MIVKMQKLKFIVLFLIIGLLYGCGNGIKYYVRPEVDFSSIKRVAVLPFENYSSDEYADGKVRSAVIIELLSRGIDVIEPGEVVRTLRELRIRSLDSLQISDIQSIGKILNVDAVFMGSVETFGISKGITVSYPEVSLYLMLIESTTGNIIWSVWHTTGGASFWTRHFGAENRTLDETSRKVVKEAIDTLFYQF
jgi:TolB-like protein